MSDPHDLRVFFTTKRTLLAFGFVGQRFGLLHTNAASPSSSSAP